MTTANAFEQILQQQSVFRDRNIMSAHYVPRILPFREEQVQKITASIAPALMEQKPNNLFVYGKVGTGKTCTIKFVLQQMKEYAEKNHNSVLSHYVNCRNYDSKYKVLLKIATELLPQQQFIGYSSAFIQQKILQVVQEKKCQLVVALDEIDKVKDLNELVYALSRSNDELESGSISMIGISNNVLFKERLDARTKSSLCQHEMVFAPYNAEELHTILQQRAQEAFFENRVQEGAIRLASAIAAKESGDARTAVMLLQRAGDMADQAQKNIVSEEEVTLAKSQVEEEVTLHMISTFPEQEQWVLYTMACLSLKNKPLPNLVGTLELGTLTSGEVFEEYEKLCR